MNSENVLKNLKEHVENIKHDLIKDNKLYTEEEAKELAKQAYYRGRYDENPNPVVPLWNLAGFGRLCRVHN